MLRDVEPRLVRIPRPLLHLELAELPRWGVSEPARAALRELIADLPLVPDASTCAQLVGPPAVTLPCLTVLARHIGQGLRDHNLRLVQDRSRLHAERAKLVFLTGDALAEIVDSGDPRPGRATVVFVAGAQKRVLDLLAQRERAGLASFVTTAATLAELAHWRYVDLME
jgi:hypothetical protein